MACASGSATIAVVRYQRMLAQVVAQIPTTTKVVLLADRGFGHIDLMKIATQLGWRWCKHAVANQKWLHYLLWLPPNPDPEPAIASWKQFYRPVFELHSLEWL